MHFSVIYSVDIPSGVNMRPYVPPHCKKLWDETEDDGQYEYGYLEGRWKHGHHRKWCALLTAEQFAEFVSHVGIFPESTPTMGSIGAPGFGFGWAPAISFRSDDEDSIQSAYVTPCGSAAELVAFLAQQGVEESHIPRVLTDDPDQGYLPGFQKQIESERERVWELLRETVIEADW